MKILDTCLVRRCRETSPAVHVVQFAVIERNASLATSLPAFTTRRTIWDNHPFTSRLKTAPTYPSSRGAMTLSSTGHQLFFVKTVTGLKSCWDLREQVGLWFAVP